MAASVMASIPLFVVYIIFQSYITQGVTIGELK
jgi:ABC-type maltose transport system permease subunit